MNDQKPDELKVDTSLTELIAAVRDDIKNRRVWADRQAVWYQMRRDGLRRKVKPFPGAADMHFPLVDTVIEKFKPFYINQLFATDRLADFISKDPQMSEQVEQAAWWFDYKLKHKSNLEKEIAYVFDGLLQNGRGIVKITWDTDKKQVRFDSVEPIYLIVPADTDELQNADRIVHVYHLSPWKYKNGPGAENRKQDEDFIKRITGGKADNEANNIENTKRIREGITHTSIPDTIIVWEIYQRTKDGWEVTTISPYADQDPIRDTYGLPYKHGQAPFVDFTMEETDKSYYSPRGVTEILASFESSLCKMWNEKHDAMSYYNRPLFYADRDIPNAGNIRMRPGDILPFKISPVDRGAPPMSWDQEMVSTRMVAEQRIAVPDFGTGQQINTSERKTATEVEQISATMNTIVDMRSRMTRRQLGALYNQAWSLLNQYDDDLQYLQKAELKSADKATFEAVLTIQPNGSSDSWNQMGRLKKAVNRFQMFAGSPFVDQGELTKSILELDEPGLVQKVYRDPGTAQQDQVKRIMLAIPSLEDGMAVPIDPSDDNDVQGNFLVEYLAREAKQGKQLTPEGQQALSARLKGHIEALSKSNPKAAHALQAKAIAIVKNIAAMHQQAQQQQGVIPFPGKAANSAVSPDAGAPAPQLPPGMTAPVPTDLQAQPLPEKQGRPNQISAQ